MDRKNKRLLITLSVEKLEMLEKMMKEDFEDDTPMASYITRLIPKEMRRREEEKSKRPVGRPRKDGDEEEEANIPHPDQLMNAGRMITRSEYEDILAVKGGKR